MLNLLCNPRKGVTVTLVKLKNQLGDVEVLHDAYQLLRKSVVLNQVAVQVRLLSLAFSDLVSRAVCSLSTTAGMAKVV